MFRFGHNALSVTPLTMLLKLILHAPLLQAKGLKPVSSERLIKVYCRVSSAKQKNELQNRIKHT